MEVCALYILLVYLLLLFLGKPYTTTVQRKQDPKGVRKKKKVFEPKTMEYIKKLNIATIERRKDITIKIKDPKFHVEVPKLTE